MIHNYESTYKDLVNKTGKPNTNLRRNRSLFIEIFRTLNNLNPELMKDLFRLCATKRVPREKYLFNLEIPKSSQVQFGARSLHIQGPEMWNSLLYHFKVNLKNRIKNLKV